jgi:hypothetical protein
VDAINNFKEFYIMYPESHDKQRKMAQDFKQKSAANFDVCVGAIDGILIWTHKPTNRDCEKLQLGHGKSLCGRNNKYGLNCQAMGGVITAGYLFFEHFSIGLGFFLLKTENGALLMSNRSSPLSSFNPTQSTTRT